MIVRAVEETQGPGAGWLMPKALRDVAASFSDRELQCIRRFLRESADALKREAESLRHNAE